MNHMLHIAAISQIRLDTEGRTYYRRKLGEAKTRKEARRCLKRRLADMVYRQLVADARQAGQRASRRVREGTRGRLQHPARPTYTPRSSALRISHNPDPQHRRYPRNHLVRRPVRARLHCLRGDKRRRTLTGTETPLLTQRGTEMTLASEPRRLGPLCAAAVV